MTLNDFTKEELIAAIYGLRHENWIKNGEQQAIRYALEERERRINAELNRRCGEDIATLKELTELAKKYENKPVKDIPSAEVERLIYLQDKFSKSCKKREALRKRQDECYSQIKRAWRNLYG